MRVVGIMCGMSNGIVSPTINRQFTDRQRGKPFTRGTFHSFTVLVLFERPTRPQSPHTQTLSSFNFDVCFPSPLIGFTGLKMGILKKVNTVHDEGPSQEYFS